MCKNKLVLKGETHANVDKEICPMLLSTLLFVTGGKNLNAHQCEMDKLLYTHIRENSIIKINK